MGVGGGRSEMKLAVSQVRRSRRGIFTFLPIAVMERNIYSTINDLHTPCRLGSDATSCPSSTECSNRFSLNQMHGKRLCLMVESAAGPRFPGMQSTAELILVSASYARTWGNGTAINVLLIGKNSQAHSQLPLVGARPESGSSLDRC